MLLRIASLADFTVNVIFMQETWEMHWEESDWFTKNYLLNYSLNY